MDLQILDGLHAVLKHVASSVHCHAVFPNHKTFLLNWSTTFLRSGPFNQEKGLLVRTTFLSSGPFNQEKGLLVRKNSMAVLC